MTRRSKWSPQSSKGSGGACFQLPSSSKLQGMVEACSHQSGAPHPGGLRVRTLLTSSAPSQNLVNKEYPLKPIIHLEGGRLRNSGTDCLGILLSETMGIGYRAAAGHLRPIYSHTHIPTRSSRKPHSFPCVYSKCTVSVLHCLLSPGPAVSQSRMLTLAGKPLHAQMQPYFCHHRGNYSSILAWRTSTRGA